MFWVPLLGGKGLPEEKQNFLLFRSKAARFSTVMPLARLNYFAGQLQRRVSCSGSLLSRLLSAPLDLQELCQVDL